MKSDGQEGEVLCQLAPPTPVRSKVVCVCVRVSECACVRVCMCVHVISTSSEK